MIGGLHRAANGGEPTVSNAAKTNRSQGRSFEERALGAASGDVKDAGAIDDFVQAETCLLGDICSSKVFATPWRLAASGVLGWSVRDRPERGVGSNVLESRMERAAFASNEKARQKPEHFTVRYDTALPRSPGFGGAEGIVCRAASTGNEAALQVALGYPGPPQKAEWLARWSRWIAGSEPTLRVRDYRIDDDGKQTLVEGAVLFSQESGVPLERIFLNGHEVWRKE